MGTLSSLIVFSTVENSAQSSSFVSGQRLPWLWEVVSVHFLYSMLKTRLSLWFKFNSNLLYAALYLSCNKEQ